VNQLVHLFLLANLRISQVKEARFLGLRAFLLAESFELQDHNLRHFVKFEFLGDITVLFAIPAVELISTTKNFFAFIALETGLQGDTSGFSFITDLNIPWLEVLEFGSLILHHDTNAQVSFVVHFVENVL
jgi:hypothetical protein